MEARVQARDADAGTTSRRRLPAGDMAWWQSGTALWSVGGLLMLANLPVTLIGIMPRIIRLMATHTATSESAGLTVKWGALHGIRTCLGFAGTATFLLASLQTVLIFVPFAECPFTTQS